jgi:hypothetical protein
MLEFPRWLLVLLEFEVIVLLFFVALALPVAFGVLVLGAWEAWERHKRNRR